MAANKGYLAGKTIFITGASRGIGRAIALKAASDGAKIVIAAKTTEPHPKLPGTIYTVAKEVEQAGGQCLPCVVDIRSEDQVNDAVSAAVSKFGGIDILVNNASAISLTNTSNTPMKRYDLMMGINARGTYLCSKACLPHLQKGNNPHILNISPPLNMKPIWFKNHVAYTMAKYGMSMCVLGMADEFREYGISVNALWPRTAIMTAAMEMLGGGPEISGQCRKPEIMSDAAYVIFGSQNLSTTGKFLIDDEVLEEAGVSDMEQYACVPGSKLLPDFFLDEANPDLAEEMQKEGGKPKFSGGAVADGGPLPVKETFKGVESMLNEEIVGQIKAVYTFDLTEGADDVCGEWTLDLKSGTGGVSRGADSPAHDCHFTLTCKDFVDMFQGKLQPTQAFMEGKLKIKGNLMAAMRLESLMKKMPRSKL